MIRLSKAIKSIFFAISCVCLPLDLLGDVMLAPGMMLRISEDNGETDQLRAIVRQLDRYARKAKLKRSGEKMVIICGNYRELRLSGRNLRLPGDISLWRQDSRLRQKLYGILASHRFNFRFPEDSAGVAMWIVNGIDAELEAAATSGQYLAANRQYPLLYEAASLNGKMPNFAAMCRLGTVDDPLSNALLGEQARLLLDLSAGKGSIRDFFESACRGDAPDAAVKRFRWDDSNSEFTADAEAALWDQYSPMPAALALKRVKELDKIYIQKAENDGSLTGEFISCDHRELAKLLRSKRKDARQIRMDFAAGFIRLGKMLPAPEQKECSGIVIAISRFGLEEEEKITAEFDTRMAGLKKLLQRRLARSRFFYDTLDRNSALPDRFGKMLNTVKTPPRTTSDAEMTFFRQTLNSYLR